MTEETIQYKFSPFSIFIGWLIFSILFIVEGIILVSLWTDKAYIAISILILLVLFISYEGLPKLIKFTKHFFKNEPALILAETQLVDNVNNKIYKWSEIKRIKYQLNYPANHISIAVKTPSKFLKSELNSYDRFIMKLNTKYFNGTFSLKPTLIKCKKEELVENLNLYLKNNTHNTQ
jgi:hypothetical protein